MENKFINNVIDVNNLPFSFTGRIERLPYLYTKIGLVCFWFLFFVYSFYGSI